MITGGQGFTGRPITQRLAAGGRRVISYDRDFATVEDGALMVQGELFGVPRLVRVLREHRIEQIVHTAAMSHPTLSLDFPIATFAANVEGTLSLLEAARLAGARRVVNFSSEAVYGATAGPLIEEIPVKPSTPYAVTKVTGEWLGKVYSNLRRREKNGSLIIAEAEHPREMLIAKGPGQRLIGSPHATILSVPPSPKNPSRVVFGRSIV